MIWRFLMLHIQDETLFRISLEAETVLAGSHEYPGLSLQLRLDWPPWDRVRSIQDSGVKEGSLVAVGDRIMIGTRKWNAIYSPELTPQS